MAEQSLAEALRIEKVRVGLVLDLNSPFKEKVFLDIYAPNKTNLLVLGRVRRELD